MHYKRSVYWWIANLTYCTKSQTAKQRKIRKKTLKQKKTQITDTTIHFKSTTTPKLSRNTHHFQPTLYITTHWGLQYNNRPIHRYSAMQLYIGISYVFGAEMLSRVASFIWRGNSFTYIWWTVNLPACCATPFTTSMSFNEPPAHALPPKKKSQFHVRCGRQLIQRFFKLTRGRF